VFLDRLQVGHLARCTAVQIGFPGQQLRAFDRCRARPSDPAHRRVEQFDQAELDFIDRQRRPRHRIEVADGIGS
jgi:hypothetical protein